MKVLGVLAGADFPADRLRKWAESADLVYAADGGADRLIEAGIQPKTLVGDMDSVSDDGRRQSAIVLHDTDQNSTDCDKLLAYLWGKEHRTVTLACAEGDLLDHVLGTLHSAARASVEVRLLLRKGLGYILKGPTDSEFSTEAGRRISLLPITSCKGAAMSGVQWTFEGRDLEPAGFNSLSNLALGESARVRIASGAAFLFIERTALEPEW